MLRTWNFFAISTVSLYRLLNIFKWSQRNEIFYAAVAILFKNEIYQILKEIERVAIAFSSSVSIKADNIFFNYSTVVHRASQKLLKLDV